MARRKSLSSPGLTKRERRELRDDLRQSLGKLGDSLAKVFSDDGASKRAAAPTPEERRRLAPQRRADVQSRRAAAPTPAERRRLTPQRRADAAVKPTPAERRRLRPQRAAALERSLRDDFGGGGDIPEKRRRGAGSVFGLAAIQSIPGVGAVAKAPVVGPALTGLAEATVTHPGKVIPRTVRGAVDIAAATPAGIAQGVVDVGVPLVTGRPGKAAEGAARIARDTAEDYVRRYGPLLRGREGYDEYVRRIVAEGAAPELLDAATVVSAGGATAGRVAGAAARAGKLGERAARVATEPRPALRISGNVSRPQELSRNLFRAAGQKAHDELRGRRLERRSRRAAAREAAGGDDAQSFEPLRPDRGEVRPLSRRLEAREQRKHVSRIQSRAYMDQRRAFDEEVRRGVARDIRQLPRHEQEALFHGVQGLLPEGENVTAASIRAAVRGRRRQIVGEREARVVERALRRERWSADDAHSAGRAVRAAREKGSAAAGAQGLVEDLRRAGADERVVAAAERSAAALDEVLRDPKVIRNHSELRALERIEANAEKLAGSSTFRQARAAIVERSKRTEAADPAFDEITALARRYEPQGELVGIPNPVREAERRIARQVDDGTISRERGDELLAEVERTAPERLRAWVDQVRAEAARRGLPEPGYVLHQPDLRFRLSDLTLGSTGKAMRGTRRSNQELFRRGAATTHPRVLVQGVATNVKRRHQWAAVAETFERHTFPWALDKSLNDLQKELRARGLDPADYMAVDMGRFRAMRQGLETDGEMFGVDPSLNHALAQALVPLGEKGEKGALSLDEREASGVAPEYKRTNGFSLVPREVGRELLDQTRPPGMGTRVFAKLQGLQSAAILGLNPSWLLMQVAANTLVTTFGVRGALGDLAKASPLYKELSPAEREMLDRIGGIGVLEGHTGQHLGAAARGPVVEAARRMGDTRVGEVLRTVNPVRLMFLADDAQNKAFRRGVLTNAMKRKAFERIRRESGRMAEAQARVEQLLRLKPTETVLDQVRRVLQNPHEVERLATHANNVLGDYVRYTARERRSLKTYVIFYGFLRYALRTAFYTMPVHHPVMASIALQLGKLHVDEVNELLGGDGAPWAYSRIYFEKDGKLRSIDLGRISPVTSPLTDVVTEGPKALAGLTSPIVQAAFDQIYGGVVFEGGRGFKVGGSASENRNPGGVDRGRIVLGQLLSAAFPYRFAEGLRSGGARMGDDSLLWDMRPIVYKSAAARARNEQRVADTPGALQQLLQQVFPLFVPKPDHTRESLEAMGRAGGSRALPGPAPRQERGELDEIRDALRQDAGLGPSRELEELRRALVGG